MAKSPNPNNNYYYGKLGYFVTFQMAIIKESPPTDSVAFLSVEGFHGGKQYSLDSVGVFDYDFQGSGTYRNFVRHFSVQVTPPPIRPLRFTLMGYNPGNNTITLYDSIDIRVYWCGKRTTYLANVTIDDSTSSNLYSGIYDGAIQTEVNQYAANYPNMQRLYLQDEPLVPAFLPLRYVDSRLQSDFGPGSARGRAITANWYRGSWLSRFLQDAQPNEYLFDGDYVIDASVPSPSMNAQQAITAGVAPWSGNGQYTISVQMKFDTLTGNLHSLDSSAQITSKPWWAVPQLHGKFYRTTPNHGYRDSSNDPDLRPPTGNELTAMINTEIAYGAKGIIAYPYGTDLTNDSSFAFPGLVSLTVSSDGIHRDHYSNMGWLPTTGNSYDSIYTGYKEKWDALAAVNANLKVIGPTLATLTWQGAMSWNTHIPSGNWSGIVTNISTNIVGDTLYIETGDLKAGSTDYVYVVNRRTLATDSRNITVTLNTGGTSWEISDVASGNSWIVGPNSSGNYFTDSFLPGQGKLYKVGSATYTSTRTIAAGTTMTVCAGATAKFAQNTSLTINGKLIVNGTAQSMATFTQSGSNGWNGIALNYDSSTINNCIISYASSPLIITNVNTATIAGCIIDSSAFSGSQAISVSNSTPNIVSVQINGQSGSSNGVRYANGRGGTLQETLIQNCGAGNGIVIQGNSNPTISNCTIGSNYFYGIIVTANGTGVPLITDNDFNSNGTHGSSRVYFNLYFNTNSRGTVQGNYMSGSNSGVGAWNGSFPTAGNNGQKGSNTITGNDYGLISSGSGTAMGFGSYNPGKHQYNGTCNTISGSTYYDALAVGGSTITAEYNWWGQSPPNWSKIYYESGSYIDSANWLTSQGGCPGGDGNVIVQRGSSLTTGVDSSGSASELYQRATNALLNKDYSTSSILCRLILRKNASVTEKQQALVRLLSVFLQSGDTTILSDLKSNMVGSDSLSKIAEELLVNAYMASGNTSKAVSLANDLIAKNSGTDIEKRALLLLASLRAYDKSAEAISAQALKDVKSRFGSSLDQGLITALTTANDVSAGGSSSNKKAALKAKDEAKVDNANTVPTEYGIENYPNPFNPTTTIAYQLPKDGRVTIKIFDAIGREVTTLVDEFKPSGRYSVQFDASRLSSGIYFYSLRSGDYSAVKKMSLIK